MTLLVGALTIGLILSLLALGVLISFRIFGFSDITPEGSVTFGAAVAAMLLVQNSNPFLATSAGFVAGMTAGAVTGILHTRFKINSLLSGILVMTALYSINLHVMGKSNIPLLSETTFVSYAELAGSKFFGESSVIQIVRWEIPAKDLSTLIVAFVWICIVGLLLFLFFRTNLGTAMRATGDNPQMIRALGVNVERMIVLGLTLSNGLIGLSGALLAQYQGFADVQMGIGMVVIGLASVIIGEALVGIDRFGLRIVGAVMGAVLFRLLIAIALRWGLNPNDLKLMTAVFVFVALILPQFLQKIQAKNRTASRGA